MHVKILMFFLQWQLCMKVLLTGPDLICKPFLKKKCTPRILYIYFTHEYIISAIAKPALEVPYNFTFHLPHLTRLIQVFKSLKETE